MDNRFDDFDDIIDESGEEFTGFGDIDETFERPPVKSKQPVRKVDPANGGNKVAGTVGKRPPRKAIRTAPVNRNGMGDVKKRQSLIDIDEANKAYNESFSDELVLDKTVQELNEAEEKQRVKVKTPEQKKKTKIIYGCIAGAVVVAVGALVAFKVLHSDPGVDFTVVNVEDYKFNGVVMENVDVTGTSGDGDTQATETPNRVKREYTAIKDLTNANMGEALKVDVLVNEKLDGSDNYQDYETYYNVGWLEMFKGYDEVKKVVDEYNKNGSMAINIGEASEYSDDIDVAIFRIGLDYPIDYPTSNGLAYEIPEVKLSMHGTYIDEKGEKDYSNSIVIDDNAYSIVEPVKVYDQPEKVDINTGFNYDFLVKLPKGTTGKDYYLTVNIGDDVVIYQGQ